MKVLHLYSVPSGRIRRLTWWMATIVQFVSASVAVVVLLLLSEYFRFHVPPNDPARQTVQFLYWSMTNGPLLIIGIWCWFVLSVKRLHDQNASAWWVLLFFIPFIGFLIWLVVLGFMSGDEGPNRYDPEDRRLVPMEDANA